MRCIVIVWVPRVCLLELVWSSASALLVEAELSNESLACSSQKFLSHSVASQLQICSVIKEHVNEQSKK